MPGIQLNTAWIKFTAFVFSCLFTALLFSLKKWAYLKYERVLLFSNDWLVGFPIPSLSIFFFKCKVVSCSQLQLVAKRLSFAFLCLSSKKIKYYTPYGKVFFQILWGINVKATHNCLSGPIKKNKEEKKI